LAGLRPLRVSTGRRAAAITIISPTILLRHAVSTHPLVLPEPMAAGIRSDQAVRGLPVPDRPVIRVLLAMVPARPARHPRRGAFRRRDPMSRIRVLTARLRPYLPGRVAPVSAHPISPPTALAVPRSARVFRGASVRAPLWLVVRVSAAHLVHAPMSQASTIRMEAEAMDGGVAGAVMGTAAAGEVTAGGDMAMVRGAGAADGAGDLVLDLAGVGAAGAGAVGMAPAIGVGLTMAGIRAGAGAASGGIRIGDIQVITRRTRTLAADTRTLATRLGRISSRITVATAEWTTT